MSLRTVELRPFRPLLAAIISATIIAGIPAATFAETPVPPATGLAAPFVDHAILQRDTEVPVWGWADPGTEVRLEFAGQMKSAVAGEDGKWMLKLDPLEASAVGRSMVLTGKGGHRTPLNDILVGEVWMASGQSNMQWLVSSSNTAALLAQIKEQAGQFSAIAFAFAHKLYQELGVPIGILNCSFSQTSIEAWTPRVGYKGSTSEINKAIEAKLLETDPSTPEHE